MTPPTIEQLARAAVMHLDTADRYFRTRAADDRREMVAAEKRLRELAAAVLHPQQTQPLMFGEE